VAGRLSSKQKKELLKEVRAARKNLEKQMASEAGISEKQAREIIKQMGEVGQKVSDTLIANTEQKIRDTLPLSQQLAAFTDASSPEDDPYGSVLSDAADELDRIARELCEDVVNCVGAFLNGKDTGDYSEYYMFVRKIVDFKSEKEFINAQMKMLKANFPKNKSLGKVEKQAEALLRFNRVLAKMFKPLAENKHSAVFSLLQNAVAYNEHLIALQSRINKNLVGGDVDIDLGTPVPEDVITDLDEIVVGMTLISPRQIKAIYLLDETGLTEKSVSKVDFEALARSFAMQAYDNLWEAGSPTMWIPDMVTGDFRKDVEAEIEVIAMRQAKRMLASYKERGMTELGRVSDNVIAFTSDSAAYLRDEYVVPGTKAALSAAKAGAVAAASATAAGAATAFTGGSAALGAGISLAADFSAKAAAAARRNYVEWRREKRRLKMLNETADAIEDALEEVESTQYIPTALMEKGGNKTQGLFASVWDEAWKQKREWLKNQDPDENDLAAALTPEDHMWVRYVVVNDQVLKMMLETGVISQKMYDRAKKQKLPVDSVTAMLNGLKKGRSTQAEIRQVKKAMQEASQMTVEAWAAVYEQEEIDAFIRDFEEARDSGMLVDEKEANITEQVAASREALAEVVSAGIPGFYARDDERPFEDPRLNPTPRGNPTYSSTWKGRWDEIHRTEAEARKVAKMFSALGGQYRVVPHEGGFHVSDAEEDALWAAGEYPQQEEILEQRERMRKEDLAAGFPVTYNPGGVRWYA